jgi:hypothetical protein
MVRDAGVERGMAKDKLTTAFLFSFVVASLVPQCHNRATKFLWGVHIGTT